MFTPKLTNFVFTFRSNFLIEGGGCGDTDDECGSLSSSATSTTSTTSTMCSTSTNLSILLCSCLTPLDASTRDSSPAENLDGVA